MTFSHVPVPHCRSVITVLTAVITIVNGSTTASDDETTRRSSYYCCLLYVSLHLTNSNLTLYQTTALVLIIVTSALHIFFLTQLDDINFRRALKQREGIGSAIAFCLAVAVIWPVGALLSYHLRVRMPPFIFVAGFLTTVIQLLLLNVTTIEQASVILTFLGISYIIEPHSLPVRSLDLVFATFALYLVPVYLHFECLLHSSAGASTLSGPG